MLKPRSMAGLKALGLLLIFGCLAVSAEVQEQNKTGDVPRAVSEQDVRLLLNPLITQILAAKGTRPTRDPNHHHHHSPYPNPYFYYPYYYCPYCYPYHPHHNHTHPTTGTTQKPTTKPTTTKPTTTPPTPETRIPFYPPNPYYQPYIPPNGFYPQYPAQPPVIVIVSPTTPAPNTGAGTGGNNAGAGNGANPGADAGAGADPGVRYTFYPRSETEHVEDEPQYDYVDMTARNVKNDAVSIVASDSDEDKEKETFIVDTKDIKLPFGITINSSSGSDKKNKEQEALIYLRNSKRGRQLDSQSD